MTKATLLAGAIVIEQGRPKRRTGQFSEGVDDVPLYAPLHADAGTLSLPEPIADQLTTIFAGVADFHRDLKDGYQGIVLFEALTQADQTIQFGRILAAHLGTHGATYSAYLLDRENGNPPDYIAADGTPLRRTLLQSPLVFSRISSGYTVHRFHPILKQWQAHSGIDYAAPVGTQVRVTATGVVEFAGVRGQFGNLVVVRHADGLTSWYGHLSRINKQVVQGAALRQGDVIGAVGMSGLATGPHLHYALQRKGKPIDPSAVTESPSAQSYDSKEKLRVDHLIAWYETQLTTSAELNGKRY